MKLNDSFLAQMREATDLLRTAGPAAATEAIQRALGMANAPSTPAHTESGKPEYIDINAKHDQAGESGHASRLDGFIKRFKDRAGTGWRNSMAGQTVEDVEVHEQPAAEPAARAGGAGRFLSGTFRNHAGTRAYKLYVPENAGDKPLPLVVMLHGCKQNPDDFAAGTGMNRLADEQKCLVLYPGQSVNANGSNCWKWFEPADQRRDLGEPSIIADMTRKVMQEHRVDPDRVYVAGLSAGGAMASIMAASYPELYAAVAIHSGLPAGSAHDVASAFGAMKQGGKAPSHIYRKPVPVIVFHGDRDHTVNPDNGGKALSQSLGARHAACKTEVTTGRSEQGRSYTRTNFVQPDGSTIGEQWTIHGAGHAWSGGNRAGSYTDPKGPDASREMMRFFQSHPRKVTNE